LREPVVKRLFLGPLAEVVPQCHYTLLPREKCLLSASTRVLCWTFEPETLLQWERAAIPLVQLSSIPFTPQAFSILVNSEESFSLFSRLGEGVEGMECLLSSCNKSDSLRRMRLTEVLEVLDCNILNPWNGKVGLGLWEKR